MVKYITNNRKNIYSYQTYHLDDETIIYKKGQQVNIHALSRGDIVEVQESGRGYNKITAVKITVIDSWS